jgi:hypothetical protein
MTPPDPAYVDPRRDPLVSYAADAEAPASAVAWGAIFAGAAAAAVLSLILLVLGTGLGLSAMSPWAQEGASAKTLGLSSGVWIIVMQLAAAALGGYMAGRLRTRWVGLASDEVVFRDTAHGFLAWGVATLITAALLASTITSLVSSGVQAGAKVVGGAATAAASGAASAASDNAKSDNGPMSYFVDQLFRSPKARAASNGEQASSAEVTRIFTNAVAAGKMPPEDSRYLAQVVSQRTGISQQEAEKRVSETFAALQAKLNEAKEAADKARKASAAASLLLFISLLAGAFIASLCATYGGRRRDALA